MFHDKWLCKKLAYLISIIFTIIKKKGTSGQIKIYLKIFFQAIWEVIRQSIDAVGL